jgi:hypothetical protein
MSVSYTSVAAAALAVCALLGWLRGVRRAALTTFAVLAASVLTWLSGADIVRLLGRVGLRFHPAERSALFLAVCFTLAAYLLRKIAKRVAPLTRLAVSTRRQRLYGAFAGVLNCSLLLGGVIRIATPYLRAAADPQTGGWTWRLLSPHVATPAHSPPALTLQLSQITITPGSLGGAHVSIPLALVALFSFVIFVIAGTVYARILPALGSTNGAQNGVNDTDSAA